MMKPIPYGCGALKFTITRQKTLLNKLFPFYTLEIESKTCKIPILYAKKLKFKKKANY